MADHRGVAEPVPHIGVARGEAERLPLAAPADQDPRSCGLDRLRHVPRAVDVRDLPADRALRLREHRPADLQCVLQPVEALGRAWEVVAVRARLGLVPGGADPQDRPSRRHDVERGDDLRQERRVAIDHARHHRAKRDARRARGHTREHRVGLEHRVARRPDVRDLVVLVHHPERIEARLLRNARDGRDPLEQLGVRNVQEREAR